MEVKSGYKETKVGIIPNNWDVISTKYISIKITDGFHNIPKLVPAGIPLLDSTFINENFNIDIEKATKFISEETDVCLLTKVE